MRIDTNFGAVKGAKVNIIDLSHWSRQQPDMRRERCGLEPGKVGYKLIEGVLDLPQLIMSSICKAVMLQDSLVFFSAGIPTLCLSFWRHWLTRVLASLMSIAVWAPMHKDVWTFSASIKAV